MNDQVIEQIRKLAPPTNGVNNDTLTAWIEMAKEFVCERKYGDKYTKALALYTLHLMTIDGALRTENDSIEEMSRRVKSFSISGEVSESYERVSESDGTFLGQTPWGKMLRVLNRKKGMGFALLTGARGRICR